ncbi:MAG: glycan metabolism protein RagB [Bacteroidetes bacterium RBG_13_42_15]|nr:MAG: glycan metabolism protein RagB [Bacteroidetes bacterium RBG_13_42_15]
MIKYNIIRNIAFIGILLILAVSCEQEDFLETTSKSTLTDATMWASEGNADIYLNGCYRELEAKGNQPDNIDNFTSDNDAGFYYTSYNWKKGIVDPAGGAGGSVWFGTTGPSSNVGWQTIYTTVRRLNTFMAKITENKAKYSDSWYNKRMDEARFLRAYFYSEIFMKLGGLALVKEPQDRNTDTEAEMELPRSTFEETFNYLIDELTSIVNNGYLVVKYNNGNADAGRATLGAALCLKGWLHLFAASPAYNSNDPAVPRSADNLQAFADYKLSRWADAAATNKQFIDTYGHKGTGTYKLFSPMTQFWHEANEYNSEVIWDRQHVTNTMAQSFDTYGGPVWILGTYYTWGNYCPTQELVDEYQMANGLSPYNADGTVNAASGFNEQNPYVGREKRFYDFIVYDGATYKQDWMSVADVIYTRIDKVHPSKNQIDYGGDDVGNTAYYFKKRLDNAHPRGGNLDGRNYVYYRYAEVLLNYAEAQNEAVGPDASVYEAINAVRQRTGTDLPALAAGMTQAEMRAAIKRERRIELVYEGHRLYDLWRWKDAMVEMNKDLHGMEIKNTVPADNSGVWTYTKISLTHPHTFTQKMYFNPIPQAAIDRNPNLKQNFGY